MYSFIRKRSQGGFHAYGLTNVKMMESGNVVEVRKEVFVLSRYIDKYLIFFIDIS